MQYMPNSQNPGVGYIGQLAQGPDGQIYQLSQSVDGLGNVTPTWQPVDGFGQVAYDQPQLGEIRQGGDGNLYQYSQTVDGLGNIGFAWASLIPLAAQALPAIAKLFSGRQSSPPAASSAASAGTDWRQLIPQIAQAVVGALEQRGRGTSLNGFGEGGDYYPVSGLAADHPLGFMDDDLGENDGLDEFIEGLDEGPDDLRGLDEDLETVRGFDAYADDLGAPADDLNGLEGYLQEQTGGQLRGYVPRPSPSPAFVSQTTPSPLWQTLW